MLAIRAHLGDCAACRDEYEGLQETKRLVASLAFRAPRAELESLLMRDAQRAERGGIGSRLLGWTGWYSGGQSSVSVPEMPFYLRPRPIAAAAFLSVAGMWLASASLDTPADGNGALAANPSPFSIDPASAVPTSIIVAANESPASTTWSSIDAAPQPAIAGYALAGYSSGGGGTRPANGTTSLAPAQFSGNGAPQVMYGGLALDPGAVLSAVRHFKAH